MKKLKGWFLNPIVFNYIFLFNLVLSKVLFINDFMNSICKFFVLWAAIIVIYNLYKKNLRCNKFLWAFVISMFITILINYKENLYLNLVMFSFVCCYIFINSIYYEIDFDLIKKFNTLYIVLVTIFASISIFTYLFDFSFAVNEIYYGYHWDVLYGVFDNPNSGSIICVYAIFLIFMNNYLIKKNGVETSRSKFFSIIAIMLIAIYLFLADSRGSQLALVSFLFCFIFVYTFKFAKKHRLFKMITLVVMFLCLSIIVIKSPLTQTKRFYDSFKTMLITNEATQNSEKEDIPKENEKIDIESDTSTNISSTIDITNQENPIDSEENISDEFRKEENISSSRFTLWIAGLKVVKDHPVFGVGQANVLNYVKAASGDSSLNSITAGGVHNGYIDLAISNGITGLLLFAIFILFIIVKSVQRIILSKNKENIVMYLLLFSIIFAVLINNLVETSMIMAIFITTQFFWMIIGLLNNYDEFRGDN